MLPSGPTILVAVQVPSIVLWTLGILVGGFFLLIFVIFVLFPIVMFIGALIESAHLSSFPPLEESVRPKAHPILDAALAAGFTFLGHYRYTPGGRLRRFCTLALSADGLTLLQIRRGVKRHLLMTRLANRVWIVTADVSGTPDLSGLEQIEMLPDSMFAVLLEHHNSRVVAALAKPVPFELNEVLSALIQHEQEQLDQIVERGLGRYINPQRTKLRLNVSGAYQMVAKGMGEVISSAGRLNLAKQKNEQLEWGMKSQQFLVADTPPLASGPTVVDLPGPQPKAPVSQSNPDRAP